MALLICFAGKKSTSAYCHVHLWRFTLVSIYLPQFQRKYAKNVNKFAT